jgi:hypothetical protein
MFANFYTPRFYLLLVLCNYPKSEDVPFETYRLITTVAVLMLWGLRLDKLVVL